QFATTATASRQQSREEFSDRYQHVLEEVRFPRSKPGKWLMRIANKRPQHPAHLRAHQAKHDRPAAEHRLHMPAQNVAGHGVDRTARICWHDFDRDKFFGRDNCWSDWLRWYTARHW